jgi:hypothetical protein
MEIITTKKNIVIDASMLTTLMSCGRKFDLNHNLNLQSINGKSNSLEIGSIIHKVLEVYNKNLINGFGRASSISSGLAAGEMYIQGCKLCTDFISVEIPDENGKTAHLSKPLCGHSINEYPGVVNTPQESTTKPARTGWKWALETCEQYFTHYANDSWVPLEVEVVKGKILYEDDEIRILWKAKLDLTCDTNQGIFPIDHKTMKQNRDKVSLNNQFIGQCLIMNTRSMIVDEIGLQTSLKPEEKFKRVPISYSADRLIEWQSEILPYWGYKLIEYNESGYWPPNFTQCESKYGMCSYMKDVCEVDRNMREENLKIFFKVGPQWNPEND